MFDEIMFIYIYNEYFFLTSLCVTKTHQVSREIEQRALSWSVEHLTKGIPPPYFNSKEYKYVLVNLPNVIIQ